MEALDTVSHEEMNIFEGNFSGYQSMRSYYNDLEDALNPDTFLCPNDDESLSAVLSVEGIVRIDSVAYLLDYATNSVYEVYPVNSATIDSLKLKNEINNESMYVFKFSMDDEIFYPDSMISAPRLVMEDGRIMPSSNTKRAFRFLKKWWHTITGGTWGCSDNAADAKKEKDKHFYTDNNFECKKYRYKYKIKYQKSGIRFALIVKCRHYKDQDGSCSNENYQKDPGLVQFEGDFSGKVFCGNNKSEAHSVLYTNSLNNNLTSTPYKSYFYKSGSKLAKYILRGQFWLQEMDDLSSFPFIINQSCNPLNTPNNCFEIKSNWP